MRKERLRLVLRQLERLAQQTPDDDVIRTALDVLTPQRDGKAAQKCPTCGAVLRSKK